MEKYSWKSAEWRYSSRSVGWCYSPRSVDATVRDRPITSASLNPWGSDRIRQVPDRLPFADEELAG